MPVTDYLSSTPVRSEADGVDARVQVKIVDAANPGAQQMTVDSDKNAHVEMHGNKPDSSDVVMRLSEEGAPNSDGVYDVTNNTVPATAGITAQVRNAAAAASRQTMQPTAKRGTTASDTVSLDVSLHDENGEAFSASNPMPVAVVNEETGTPVHSYNTTAAVIAPGASQTITYTVTGTIMTLKRLVMAASGRIKVDILTGNSVTPTQKYTLFNAANNNNIILDIPKNFFVAVGDVVQVVFTNEDKASFTGYLTVEGMQ